MATSIYQQVSNNVYRQGQTPSAPEVKKVTLDNQIAGSMEYSEIERSLLENGYDPAIEKMILHAPVNIRTEIEQAEPQNFERQPEIDTQAIVRAKAAEEVINAASGNKLAFDGVTELVFTTTEKEIIFRTTPETSRVDQTSEQKLESNEKIDVIASVENATSKVMRVASIFGKLLGHFKGGWMDIYKEIRKSPDKKEKKPEVTKAQVMIKQNESVIDQVLNQQKGLAKQAKEADADRITEGKIKEAPEDGLAKALGIQVGALQVIYQNEGLSRNQAIVIDASFTKDEKNQQAQAQAAKEQSVKKATGQPEALKTDFENRKLSGNVG